MVVARSLACNVALNGFTGQPSCALSKARISRLFGSGNGTLNLAREHLVVLGKPVEQFALDAVRCEVADQLTLGNLHLEFF